MRFLSWLTILLILQGSVFAQNEIRKTVKLNRTLRKKVVLMFEADQYWRLLCITEKVNPQSRACREVEKIDAQNTAKLRKIIKVYGFPDEQLLGNDILSDVVTMIIHSSSLEFQKENLPFLLSAAEKEEKIKPDVAILTDKISIKEGKPQIYGTQFDIANGKMYMSPVIEPEKLNERRAAMKLPKIEEYIKILEEFYKMTVVRP